MTLPSGGLTGIGLAITVAALVTIVHRRRRHTHDLTTGHTDAPSPATPLRLPESVQVLDQAGRTASDHQAHGQTPDRPSLPVRAIWPPPPLVLADSTHHQRLALATTAGLGVTGPGAAAAARALIAGELAARYRHPTRLYLLDTTAAQAVTGRSDQQPDPPAPHDLAGIAGVHVIPDHDDDQQTVLAELETELTRRARLTETAHADDEDTHDDCDVVTRLRRTQPDLELPTLLVLATTGHHPESERDRRLRRICAQGRTLGLHGLLLGPWPNGLGVEADGLVTDTHGATHALAGTRLAHLTPEDFRGLLSLVRTVRAEPPPTSPPQQKHPTTESAAGPADAATPAPQRTAADGPIQAPATHNAAPHPPHPRDRGGHILARLQLLGVMELQTAEGTQITGLRSLSLQLLAYLGTHPEGASPGLLENELLADHHSEHPRQLLQKAVSHARTLLRQATGHHDVEFITSRAGRYHLDAHVACDALELLQALRTARTQRDDPAGQQAQHRIATLARAGPPLPEAPYRWADETRQSLTSRVLPLLRTLATHLSETHPHAALDVLETAISWEPYAESAYRQLISLHHQLGDTDAAHATFHLLRTRLADIDRRPEHHTEQQAFPASVESTHRHTR